MASNKRLAVGILSIKITKSTFGCVYWTSYTAVITSALTQTKIQCISIHGPLSITGRVTKGLHQLWIWARMQVDLKKCKFSFWRLPFSLKVYGRLVRRFRCQSEMNMRHWYFFSFCRLKTKQQPELHFCKLQTKSMRVKKAIFYPWQFIKK